MAYGPNIKDECVKWIEQHGLMDYGGATKAKFLEAMQIAETTWRRWMKEDKELVERVNAAKESWKKAVKDEAFVGLMELCRGYTVKETSTEYVPNAQGKPIINKQKTFERHIPKNPTAIIFALTNLDPDNWKNRQDLDSKLSAEGINITIGKAPGGKPARKTEEDPSEDAKLQPTT